MINYKIKNAYKKKLATVSLISGVFIIALFYQTALAITTDKTEYWSDEGILLSGAVASNNALFLYDLSQTADAICATSEGQIQSAGSAGLVSVCSVTGNFMPAGSYSLIELSGRRANCNGLSYTQCKESSNFINEALFSVRGLPPPPPVIITPTGGGGTPPPEPTSTTTPEQGGGGGGGPTAYRPEVKIISPEGGKSYGNIVEINYEATDKNDVAGQPDLGMRENPVTIYYSKTADIRQKIQLGANLPAKGVFKWDTKDLPEADTYRITIEATDKSNELGWISTEEFSIDHTIPYFTIKADPNVTRGEDVKMIIESTKELSEPPKVTVKQNEYREFDLILTGEKDHFEGVYKVVSGYDGPAEIKIKGKDLSGNESESIISGGQFSVGVEPPPKPIISSPLDKDIVASEFIDIKGKARSDTEITLTVNGSDKYVVFPNKDGDFVFSHIKIKEDFNRGLNFLNIVSTDAAKNVSEATTISLKFNVEPRLSIVSPVSGQKISTTTEIVLNVVDKNKDILNFVYEISRDGGKNWTIIEESKNKKFLWNTSDFSDGEYSLRVSVSDGFSKKIVKVDGIIIENLSPIINFTDGDNTNINSKDYLLQGTASVSDKISGASMNNIEYSMDSGESWTSVKSGSSRKESFSVSFNNLEERKYKIIFRAGDSRGVYGKAIKTLVVDFGPPLSPVIESPEAGATVDMSFDIDKNKDGLQIAVSGRAEPLSIINANVDDKVYSGDTDSKGNFKISGVYIPKHGDNKIAFIAIDGAGNKSESSSITIKYNNPPIVKFINPRMGRGLNHKAIIEFDVVDPDFDPVKNIVLSYRENSGASFKVLAKDPVKNKFDWNVSNFPSSKDYELKVEATDGASPASKINRIFIDNTPPKVNLEILKSREFKSNFTFEATGFATDDFSGIEYVEYSLDEEHWFKAGVINGFLSKNVTFRIRHPFNLEDGDYKMSYRAVDVAGNISQAKSEDIRVDTTGPRIGSFILTTGQINLYPEGGKFIVPENIKLTLKLSLEGDTSDAAIYIDGQMLQIFKNNSSGLWEVDFNSGKEGGSEIKVTAIDKLGNKTEGKRLIETKVLRLGSVKEKLDDGSEKILAGATITAYIFDLDRQSYVPWPAESYGMQNPARTDAKGDYTMLLPQGKYDLRIKAEGFINTKTTEFILEQPKFINLNFLMQPQTGVRGFIDKFFKKIMISQWQSMI